ncbi:MAG TPA: ABC transporter ATP-binding protein [Hyphomicrobiaceae bacterium]|nr:ABC transporter ATP-binding protein [Hyphomicrobiaceae bacterium]
MATAGESKPISIQGVGKVFVSATGERVEALSPTTFDIAAGEFISLVGPSGCGKSTLLSILAGLLDASSGEALIDGVPIRGPAIDRGMVFQSYALFPWLNVIGNVEFGLERMGLDKRERREIAMNYLTSVGLKDFASKQVNELSGGMKQRVAIARAFATKPSTILMDEPFGALDALTRRSLQKQLLAVWEEHRKTVVFVTHSVPEAIALSDRVVVMTARPGSIKSVINIDLEHPRDASSDAFRDYERQIYGDLDAELAKTFALEGQVAS